MACLAVSGSAWRWGPRRAWSSGFFFFQAEDGIRAGRVPGVQTCALPILRGQVLHLRDVATRIDGKRGRDAGTYAQDRKSVVEGKSVDLGGCGIIKKKTKMHIKLGREEAWVGRRVERPQAASVVH